MKTTRNILCLSLLVFSLYACSTTREDDDKNIYYDDFKECSHLVNLFEGADYEIIPMETDSLAVPAVGMKFLAYQDYFLICDNHYAHTIFLYDNQGKFLHTIGSKGKGAQEYVALIDFSVCRDTISIADIGKTGNHFLYYELDGHFLKKTDLSDKIVSFAQNSKGEYIINSGRNAYQANWQITRYSNDLKIIEQCWELTENENNIPVFEHNFSNSDDGIFFHEAFNNQLYKWIDNQVEASYQLVFDGKNDFSKVYTGNFMTEVDSLYKEGFYLLNGYLENESNVFLLWDYIKESKTEKQILGVYHKKLKTGKIFETAPSSMFMGNLKDNTLYLMVSDNLVEDQLPDTDKPKDTDIFILKIML